MAGQFVAETNAAYGLYLDALMGFTALADLVVRNQKATGSKDDSQFFYGQGPPTDPKNVLLHQTTQGALKQRVQRGGRHYFLMGRWLIVLVYELWEAGYRTPFAQAAGIDRGTLFVSVFGDLRRLRHDILHRKGVLNGDTVNRLEVLPHPLTGCVDYDEEQVRQIIGLVKAAVDELVLTWTGVDPAYRTVWRVA